MRSCEDKLKRENRSLPVAVRVSKTCMFKLSIITWKIAFYEVVRANLTPSLPVRPVSHFEHNYVMSL